MTLWRRNSVFLSRNTCSGLCVCVCGSETKLTDQRNLTHTRTTYTLLLRWWCWWYVAWYGIYHCCGSGSVGSICFWASWICGRLLLSEVWIRILQSSSNSWRKTLIPTVLWLLLTLIFEKRCKKERKKERSFIFFAQLSIQHGLYATGNRLWYITLQYTLHTEWPKGLNVAVLRGTARIGQISPVSHVNVLSKSKKKNFKKWFLLATWRLMTKIAWSRSSSQRRGSADPDPHQNVKDPQHWYLIFWYGLATCRGCLQQEVSQKVVQVTRGRVWQLGSASSQHAT